MKITKSQLREIIREEINNLKSINEKAVDGEWIAFVILKNSSMMKPLKVFKSHRAATIWMNKNRDKLWDDPTVGQTGIESMKSWKKSVYAGKL